MFLTMWQYLQYEWWPEYLKNQTEKITVVEWNEDMIVETRNNPVFSLRQYSFTESLFHTDFICHASSMYWVSTHDVAY